MSICQIEDFEISTFSFDFQSYRCLPIPSILYYDFSSVSSECYSQSST
nr:MAG TPA: hypothetical protein [Caudoviricetes sp.]